MFRWIMMGNRNLTKDVQIFFSIVLIVCNIKYSLKISVIHINIQTLTGILGFSTGHNHGNIYITITRSWSMKRC